MIDKREWMRKSGFCDRLREAREKAGYTREQVAANLETVKEYVFKVENAQTCPSIAKVCAMAELYEVTIDWLCGRKEENDC